MNRSILAIAALFLGFGELGAQSIDAAALYRSCAPAVFRVASRYGQGSGFLIDSIGLLVTNAHVVTGSSVVTVQVSDSVRVEGLVAAVDPLTDAAVVRIHPSAIARVRPLHVVETAPPIGEQVVALGFPLARGPVLTTGRVGYVLASTLMLDLNLNPGNSGGPVLNVGGDVVGMSTFRLTPDGGQGLAGAIAGRRLDSLVAVARARNEAEPKPERLPVLSTQVYPWAALDSASREEKWPENLYDVSKESTSRSTFSVQIFTPPFLHRRLVRSHDEGLQAEDLRRYQLELGEYPPAVIVRITPRIQQSGAATAVNLLGGFASGFSGRAFTPVYSPEVSGDIRSVVVQRMACAPTASCAGDLVIPIEERHTTLEVNGQIGDAVYLLLDPAVFAPEEGRTPRLLVSVTNAKSSTQDGIWIVPERTVSQVWQDFAPMRR